jgi:predicted nucleic-acid-binding Zn-ribbon protein
MKTSALSPAFLEAVRAHVEEALNYEYSYSQRKMVRKRDRSKNDLSQIVLPLVTVTEVIDFEDETYYGGYCETCSYEETHCVVTYKTADSDMTKRYEYSGSFLSLLESLVD